jgi:hypothetical protein
MAEGLTLEMEFKEKIGCFGRLLELAAGDA